MNLIINLLKIKTSKRKLSDIELKDFFTFAFQKGTTDFNQIMIFSKFDWLIADSVI